MRDRPAVLLCCMPDVAMAFKRVGDMPNLGLPSLAGSLPDSEVRILDLHMVFKNVGKRLLHELREFKPDIVGLSSMSFQFQSAKKLARIVKDYNRAIPVALGGYHASMAFNEFSDREADLFDILVRGEGEISFARVVDGLASGMRDFSHIPSISYKTSRWVHNPKADLQDLDALPLPRREARAISEFYLFGKRIEAIETSRGCTLPCNFCSIGKMYGQSFRLFSLDRVFEEIGICIARGAEMIFFVDDNITLDVPRFKLLCQEIIRRKLNKIEYITQVSVAGMAKDPELARLMAEAGFKIVFLGIENVSVKQLKEMNKGDIRNASKKAIDNCRKNNMAVVGGFIAGLPDDGPEDISNLFREARLLGVDHIIVQCVTPYPNTDLRKKLIDDGLVTNRYDYSRYNGYICNVKTRKMNVNQLNRKLNWENIKLYFDPRYIRANRMLQRDNARKWKTRVFINSLEHFPAFFNNRLFLSRHSI